MQNIREARAKLQKDHLIISHFRQTLSVLIKFHSFDNGFYGLKKITNIPVSNPRS
jgi:hypothetical protein